MGINLTVLDENNSPIYLVTCDECTIANRWRSKRDADNDQLTHECDPL